MVHRKVWDQYPASQGIELTTILLHSLHAFQEASPYALGGVEIILYGIHVRKTFLVPISKHQDLRRLAGVLGTFPYIAGLSFMSRSPAQARFDCRSCQENFTPDFESVER